MTVGFLPSNDTYLSCPLTLCSNTVSDGGGWHWSCALSLFIMLSDELQLYTMCSGPLQEWLWGQLPPVQGGGPPAGDLQWAGGGVYQQAVWMYRDSPEKTPGRTSVFMSCQYSDMYSYLEQMASILKESQSSAVLQARPTGLWIASQRPEDGGTIVPNTQKSEGST